MAERTFTLQAGPPQQGKASSLAGVAEPGDRLLVTGLGVYVNNGSKAEPLWEPYVPQNSVFYITAQGLRQHAQLTIEQAAPVERPVTFGSPKQPGQQETARNGSKPRT